MKHVTKLESISDTQQTINSSVSDKICTYFSRFVLMVLFIGEPGLAIIIGDNDDEVVVSDNWSYKTCKAPVKSPTNQHPTFYRPDALPVTQTTVSKH